jgi:hypothetical protein
MLQSSWSKAGWRDAEPRGGERRRRRRCHVADNQQPHLEVEGRWACWRASPENDAQQIDQQLPLVLPSRRQPDAMSSLTGERSHRCRSHPKALTFVLRAALTISMSRCLDESRLALFRASPEKIAAAVIAVDGRQSPAAPAWKRCYAPC